MAGTGLLRSSNSPSPLAVVAAGAAALAVAMGIGRFAFTPLLPMMLNDGVVTLNSGSWLATANYIGYLAGALLCMTLPRSWSAAWLVRGGLLTTVVLTLGMVLPLPAFWPLLRLLAGIASAVVFIFTSGWCLARLSSVGRPALGGAIYTGPGAGIALSGIAATAMVASNWSAMAGWVAFGLLAGALSALAWPIFEDDRTTPRATSVGRDTAYGFDDRGGPEMAMLTVAYGLAGFGYIITATFLPVIAREALPGSIWLDLFWPILGLGVVTGALLATRIPVRFDGRLMLAGCYLLQALGVVMALFLPNLAGFILGSLLVGLPFTAISFFGMQEMRRLRPLRAARFMGLVTAVYGIGQIAGPPLVALLLEGTRSRAEGFALSLGIASATLVLGAALYGVMWLRWPIRATSSRFP